MLCNHLSPSPFPPPWAAAWGEDACGLWLTLGLNGIRQMFRWIRPGIFLMGSPQEESEHLRLLGKETQHEVTLSRGFWLADTAITQELWLAVMKDNPSGFREKKRPVERISWFDAQIFIQRLNSLIPGLAVRLPTEAEWEYSCRSGSETPFSFGIDMSPELVNYNSNELYRRQPLPVKSLPCNSLGLYEMHGNIWEWCQDYWQDDLTAVSVTDPCGPENGDFRVVRGGSWVCVSKYIRSASRDRYLPNYSGGSIGVRLAV
ncbi:MAG: formylglycine-generating enzyme family protein [Candidatus Electrothrix sp. AR3]|nr:formylglycine-generating enzyme family protein [Candidatus Electrothrix sp. AR3]